METIWLQRSSPDVPWGFRLVGGREFNMPLSVQRVTPGSVAAAGLGTGDEILKVGNVMATQLEHNDAMDLVRQAGNILQLTIKKTPEGQAPPGPLSPASSYGSSSQINDYSAPQWSQGNNSNYSTTPRNMGSQYQRPGPSPMGTRIEIQRVPPSQSQAQRSYSNSYDDYNGDISFPDYTIPYKQQEPVHDSPGGPYDLGGTHHSPKASQYNDSSYTSQSLPRHNANYNAAPERDTYDSNRYHTEPSFKTGMPYQSSAQSAPSQNQSSYYNSGASFNQPQYSPPQPAYTPVSSGPFSPQSYSSPMSPRNQASSTTSGYGGAEPSGTSTSTVYFARPTDFSNTNNNSYGDSYNDPSSKHGTDSGVYSTLPHTKASPSYNMYNNAPQPYTVPKPYTAPQSSGSSYQPVTPSKPSYPSPVSSGYSSYTPQAPQPYTPQAPQPYTPQSPQPYTPQAPQPYTPQAPQPYTPQTYNPQAPQPYSSQPTQHYGRKVSFDHTVQDPRSNHLRSPPPPVHQGSYDSSPAGYDRSPVSFGTPQTPTRAGPNDSYYSSPSQYGVPPSGGPMSPWSDSGSGNYGYGAPRNYGYDPAGVSAGMNNLSMISPTYEPPKPPAPPPPPPPPPPSAPPAPPAPPLNSWSSSPYRGQNYQDEPEGQKIPDQLLNTMMKSSKSGGPKPFSYGIDLSELKKKMGPPTAPKPRRGGQPQQYGGPEDDDTGYSYRPPKRPAGQVQSDYFIPRDDDGGRKPGPPRRPAGQVQSDYFLSRDGGPRAQIDDSSLRVSMGTNPKKQSKSFKVLQWMTETEQDDANEQGKDAEAAEAKPRTRRPTDPERRHNADDDEMRFTGLHSKADIPSKTFGRLQKMSSQDSTTQNGQDAPDYADEEGDEGVSNYEESSIRYKGKHIPSPSFRVLQTWAENDPDNSGSTGGGKKEEEEEDGLPDTLNSDEIVDKRYTGGNIPSKVFKTLQKSVGDDTSETPAGDVQSSQQATSAHASDF